MIYVMKIDESEKISWLFLVFLIQISAEALPQSYGIVHIMRVAQSLIKRKKLTSSPYKYS